MRPAPRHTESILWRLDATDWFLARAVVVDPSPASPNWVCDESCASGRKFVTLEREFVAGKSENSFRVRVGFQLRRDRDGRDKWLAR